MYVFPFDGTSLLACQRLELFDRTSFRLVFLLPVPHFSPWQWMELEFSLKTCIAHSQLATKGRGKAKT